MAEPDFEAIRRQCAETLDSVDQRPRGFLEFHRRSLALANAAFDKGDEWQAINIARDIVALVYDRGRLHHSLLGQTGIKPCLTFLSTCEERIERPDRRVVYEWPQTSFVMFDGRRFRARLGGGFPRPPRWLSFDDWWREQLMRQTSELQLSRESLIVAMRNDESGVHFEPDIRNPHVRAYATTGESGMVIMQGGEWAETDLAQTNMHFVLTRQIGFELERTLDQLLPRSGDIHGQEKA